MEVLIMAVDRQALAAAVASGGEVQSVAPPPVPVPMPPPGQEAFWLQSPAPPSATAGTDPQITDGVHAAMLAAEAAEHDRQVQGGMSGLPPAGPSASPRGWLPPEEEMPGGPAA
jgi:hypothetical protein